MQFKLGFSLALIACLKLNICVAHADLNSAVGPASLIQSNFGSSGKPGNFEALVLDGRNIVHYWRDNSSQAVWRSDDVISNSASNAASFIQSNYGIAGRPGNFEALVLEGNELVHYWRDNSAAKAVWRRANVVSPRATAPASLIQSSFGTSGRAGNFETLVLEDNQLVHYWRDSGTGAWQRGLVVSDRATGTASMIQSSFGVPGKPGNFEALVLEGNELVHYWRDNASGASWQRGAVVSDRATGPASFIQSSYGAAGKPGNFEALVLEGNELVHYWRDNAGSGSWRRAAVVTNHATGPASFIQSNYGMMGRPGNFEALIQEDNNLVHYWRDNSAANATWRRSAIVSRAQPNRHHRNNKHAPSQGTQENYKNAEPTNELGLCMQDCRLF